MNLTPRRSTQGPEPTTKLGNRDEIDCETLPLMIEAIDYILRTYPEARYSGPRHAGHPSLDRLGTVRAGFEQVVCDAVPGVPWIVKASAGIGATWANVPWIAALDPAETTSAREGRYVSLMFAADGSRLVVAVVWGTQKVRAEMGSDATNYLLERRSIGAAKLAEHLPPDHPFELDSPAPLAAGTPLARDYERSCLAHWSAPVDLLPIEEDLNSVIARLGRALAGWRASEPTGGS